MQRGTDIHTKAEMFLKGKLKHLPVELKAFEEEFALLKKRKALVEGEWAFDKDWQPTSWFGRDAWVRIKIDAVSITPENHVQVDDWKTGRMNSYKIPEYEEQVELYAIGGLLNFPRTTHALPLLDFTDEGRIWPTPMKLIARKDLPKLQKKWEKNVIPMFKEEKFTPKPGKQCSWCHFRKENDGPCPN